jgi:YrbI family 3-deoxy-D-manno-octulosonate 8-phosphate phosphatase
MYHFIKNKLQELGIQESVFCSTFGVKTIEHLPLIKIEEITHALEINRFDLLHSVKQKKAFPNDIRLLILDVDGVLTDGGMYFTENGDQAKKYNTKDGMGILYLTNNDFQVGIISSGFTGEMVKKRAEILRIQHFYLGREEKLLILKQWCKQLNISLSQVAMIGDDVNDLEVMKQVGFSACPSDAVSVILQEADCILSKKGGEGCVREFIDNIMKINVKF